MPAMIASRAARAFLGTVAPGATDDATKGYSVHSPGYDTATGIRYTCTDNTPGAAVWRSVGGTSTTGRISGKNYPTARAVAVTGTAVPAVDVLYTYPWIVEERITLAALGVRVAAVGTASSAKCALWASKLGRPFGAPLIADNTGFATTALGLQGGAVTGTIEPGIVWVGQKHTGTLPTLVALATSDTTIEDLIGRSLPMASSSIHMTALSIGNPFASAFPTFDGTETWTDHLTGSGGVGIVRYTVA